MCIYILESNVLILYEKATPMCPMCLSRVATCWGWVTRRSLEDTLLVMWTEAHLTMMLFKRTKGLALKEEGKKKKTLKKKIFRAVQLFQETAQRSDAEPWWDWLKPVHYQLPFSFFSFFLPFISTKVTNSAWTPAPSSAFFSTPGLCACVSPLF